VSDQQAGTLITARQRETINDMVAKLELDDVVIPRTQRSAAKFISLLSHKMTERFGDNLPPTSRQLECLKRLGEQRGRDYKVPATRKQASDRIRRILESQHTGS